MRLFMQPNSYSSSQLLLLGKSIPKSQLPYSTIMLLGNNVKDRKCYDMWKLFEKKLVSKLRSKS